MLSRGGETAVEVADLPLDWSIGEAPKLSLVVPDARRLLVASPGLLGDRDADIFAVVGGRRWRVTEVIRDEMSLGLTVEHRGVHAMRQERGPLAAAKGVSRAQFAQMLWRRSRGGRVGGELYVPLEIPEASGKKPPLLVAQAPVRDRSAQTRRDAEAAPGFKPGVKLKIKGQVADSAQMAVLRSAMTVCDAENAPLLARQALAAALIVESTARNLTYGHSTSTGPLQLLAATAQALNVSARDVPAVCRLFLRDGFWRQRPKGAIELARLYPGWTLGKIAQECQGSAHPNRYDQVAGEARAIVAAWSGTAGPAVDDVQETQSSFKVAEDGNYWETFKALAEDTGRRAYATLDRLYWLADSQVMRQRPAVDLYRRAPGVLAGPTWTADANLKVDTATVTLAIPDADAWALSGRTVTISGEGPADGTWLVAKWSRGSQADRSVQVELERPRPVKKASSSGGSSGGGADGPALQRTSTVDKPMTITTAGGAKGIVDQAYRICREVGGEKVFVVSAHRPGDTVSSGQPSDHAGNDSMRAARDIAHQGVNALTGPPQASLDRGIVALGRAFGRTGYGDGTSGPFQNADTFQWKGYRVQLIWRTPKWGGHLGHIHIGVRKA